MEEDPILYYILGIILAILVIIAGVVYFSISYSKCVNECTSELCKIGHCSFELTKFECNKNPLANCCGNGMCESTENSCNCGMDCESCSGIAGLCEEYMCTANETCETIPLSNCCGNGMCEISESYEKCPEDCGSVENGIILSYSGPTGFDQTNCNDIKFVECDQGHYKIIEKNELLIIGFQLPQYDFSKQDGWTIFKVYAKNSPTNQAYSIVSIYLNENYVGDFQLKPSYWDRADFGFDWYAKKVPIEYLNPGYNSVRLEPTEWMGVATYNTNPMSSLEWNVE